MASWRGPVPAHPGSHSPGPVPTGAEGHPPAHHRGSLGVTDPLPFPQCWPGERAHPHAAPHPVGHRGGCRLTGVHKHPSRVLSPQQHRAHITPLRLEKRPSVLSSGSRVGTTGHKGPAARARPAASVSQRGSWLPLTAPVTQKPRSPVNPAWLGNEPQESQIQISSLPRMVGAQRAQNEPQTDAGPSAILGEEPQHHKGPSSP